MVTDRYTLADIKQNWRLARCCICRSDCFYLQIDGESRLWHHEDESLDYHHKAEPGGGRWQRDKAQKAIEYIENRR